VEYLMPMDRRIRVTKQMELTPSRTSQPSGPQEQAKPMTKKQMQAMRPFPALVGMAVDGPKYTAMRMPVMICIKNITMPAP
jgi:hypothetical protein